MKRFFSDNSAVHNVLSVFVDDIISSHNGASGPESVKDNVMFCRVRQMAEPAAKWLSTIAGLFRLEIL